jgi:hypothetical protein
MSHFPTDNPNQPADTSPVESLIEASLDEWLSGAAPRSSVASIYEGISKRNANGLFSVEELDRALEHANSDLQSAGRLGSRSSKPWDAKLLTAASLAASIGAVALIGWWSWNTRFDDSTVRNTASIDKAIPNQFDATPSPEVSIPQEVASGEPVLDASTSPSAHGDHPLDTPELDPLGTIAENQPMGEKAAPEEPQGRDWELGGKLDREVVAVIDSQFQQIWKQLGLLDENTKDKPLSSDRVARLVLRRVPTSSELEAIRRQKLPEELETAKMVQTWMASEEFDRVWADRLANFYLGGRVAQGDAVVVFRNWLESQIRQNVSIQRIQRQVLLGLWQADHPSYFLRQHWSELASESKPSNATWVGFNEADTRRLSGLSQLFLKATGNSAIACTQCHGTDTQPPSNWLSDRLSPVVVTPGAKPVVFDSIAALMVESAQPGRNELFAREQDDRVSKIAARMPDGKRIGAEVSTQDAVGLWVDQGSRSQSGLLKSLWKDFFGQDIESEFGIDAGVATQERRDLVEYLGKQTRDQQASVRQIVYWMLMSEPARQTQEQLSYAQYLALDSQKLHDYSVRREVLKSLSIDTSGSGVPTNSTFGAYVDRIFPEQPDWLERSLLAQASSQKGTASQSFNLPGSGLSSDAEASWDQTLLRAELRYRAAGQQAQQWAKLLADSKLSESQIVQHAYLISKQRFATDTELKAWSDSSWIESQRSMAILRLLAGVDSYEP